MLDRDDRVLDEVSRVPDVLIFEILRKRFRQLRQLGVHLFGHAERIGPGSQKDADDGSVPSIDVGMERVVARSKFYSREVRNVDALTVWAELQHNVAELFW